MKKIITAFSMVLLVTGAIVTGCNTPAEKVENAENKVTEANKDLDKANEAYVTDVANYRIETANKIAANEKSIADFKARVATEKKETKEAYNAKISDLEKKDTDMKKKMDDYKLEGKEKWEIFKAEFSHDMDELGKSFKDFTVKNVK